MPPATLTSPATPAEAWRWWESRRPAYNLCLVMALLIAFLAYVVEMAIWMPPVLEQPLTITVGNVIFLGLGGGLILMLGNFAFLLGAVSETILRPSDPAAYRRHMYRLGVIVSVAIPFLLPALALAGLLGAAD